jgi:hypothetical protein
MVIRLIKAMVVAVVLAAIITSLPDIKRYLEIREMRQGVRREHGDDRGLRGRLSGRDPSGT